jgi:hypothetical protein
VGWHCPFRVPASQEWVSGGVTAAVAVTATATATATVLAREARVSDVMTACPCAG